MGPVQYRGVVMQKVEEAKYDSQERTDQISHYSCGSLTFGGRIG